MIRTAFVLGAGLGTRLGKLTAERPKPLIPVVNRPLITYAFDHLLGAGVERLVVNTHWRAEAYARAFPSGAYGETPIHFRHETPEVLETAGGLKNAEDLLSDTPFIVYNGDILSDLPLAPAFAEHSARGNEVTLVLRSSGGPLQVAFDAASGRITDLGGRVSSEVTERFLFTGIYLVNPEWLRRIPPREKLSVIPIFCEMIRARAALGGVLINEGAWSDLGSREHYLAVHQRLTAGEWLAPDAEISSNAQLSGKTAIGSHARIGADARLHDCLIWDHAEVAPGAQLERCIVTSGARAEGSHRDHDFTP